MIETHELRTVRIDQGSGQVYCSKCGERSVTVTPEQLASFLRVSLSEVCRRIDAAEIHLADGDNRFGRVCARSLEGNEDPPEAERA